MAVKTIKKTTPVVESPSELFVEIGDETLPLHEVARRYEEAEARVSELKKDPAFDEYSKLKKALSTLIPDSQLDDIIELVDAPYSVTLGKVGQSREVTDVRRVHEFLGDAFYDVVSVKLGDIDDYLTKPQRDQVITVNRTGTRSVKIKAIGSGK